MRKNYESPIILVDTVEAVSVLLCSSWIGQQSGDQTFTVGGDASTPGL